MILQEMICLWLCPMPSVTASWFLQLPHTMPAFIRLCTTIYMKVMLLVGAPRCGKTQLALQMCENKRSVFYDVRSSSLKSFLEHIDTNVDVMVFDDIPEWQLQYYEALVRGDYFQGDFTVVLTTNYFPEWVTKYPDVLVLDEIGIKKNGSSVIAKVRNYEKC